MSIQVGDKFPAVTIKRLGENGMEEVNTGELFAAAAPFATGGVYVNFMPEDEADRIAGAYGVNHPRLGELKDRYDPANLFRMNQNIRPSGAAGASPQTPPLTTPR